MSEAALRSRVERQGWARPGGRHDWVIRVARLALPLGILALVALLAAAPLRREREVNFLVDKKTAERAPERMRLQTAHYTGVDARGRPFTLDAGSAVQADARQPFVTIREMRAELQLDTGPAVVSAPSARYDLRNQTVAVDGPVRFRSADGYRLDGGAALIDLRRQTLRSAEPLRAVAADGRTVESEAAEVDLNARTVASRAPVSYAAPDGFRLRAGEAAVDVDRRRLVSSRPVRGELELGAFTAGRMTADLAARRVVLDGGVRLHIVQGALK